MRKIDVLIDEVLTKLKPGDYEKRNKVITLWKSIVGEDLAKFVVPAGYEGSILLLRINHPAAAMEVRIRKKDILDKLNSFWDEELFTDLVKV